MPHFAESDEGAGHGEPMSERYTARSQPAGLMWRGSRAGPPMHPGCRGGTIYR